MAQAVTIHSIFNRARSTVNWIWGEQGGVRNAARAAGAAGIEALAVKLGWLPTRASRIAALADTARQFDAEAKALFARRASLKEWDALADRAHDELFNPIGKAVCNSLSQPFQVSTNLSSAQWEITPLLSVGDTLCPFDPETAEVVAQGMDDAIRLLDHAAELSL